MNLSGFRGFSWDSWSKVFVMLGEVGWEHIYPGMHVTMWRSDKRWVSSCGGGQSAYHNRTLTMTRLQRRCLPQVPFLNLGKNRLDDLAGLT